MGRGILLGLLSVGIGIECVGIGLYLLDAMNKARDPHECVSMNGLRVKAAIPAMKRFGSDSSLQASSSACGHASLSTAPRT